MKKIFLVIFILIITPCFGISPVSAQNATREQFETVFAQYRDKYDEYVSAHNDYVLSKKQYEQYKTLSSKENLQKDLQSMLLKRDEVMILYYRAIISKMDDSSIRMPEDRKIEYTRILTDEVNWLDEHKTQYKINDSPQTLASKSEEVDNRFQLFQNDLYQALYYLVRGKVDMYDDLFSLTEKIKNEQREAYKLSDSKIEIIDRWFGEISTKNDEYVKLLAQADAAILKAESRNSKGVYENSMKTLNNAMNVFKDRLMYTKEIIREIKVSESEN